jgi:multiple sugar transport system substrate-binding protein
MLETVKKLSSAKISSPVLLPTIQPFGARIHISASWVWGAQGDFMSADGQDVLLAEPAALKGLSAFYKLYRVLSPADTNLTYDDCLQRFLAGNGAVICAGIGSQSVISQCNNRSVLDNLGIAALPGIPWIGGSNLVIWNETRMFPAQEKAALTLIRFLASVMAQKKYAINQNVIPARIEALAEMEFETPQLKEVCEKSLRTGRSYHAGPGWMRMLSELRYRFDVITTEVLSDREMDIDKILEKHLVPVADRFKLLISH